MEGNIITIGKADDSHDFLIPLVCALNQRIKPGSIAICDTGPGVSGYVLTAIRDTTLAVIVLKPARGWKRNIDYLLGMLEEEKITFGIVINKFRDEKGFFTEVEEFCKSGNIPLLGVIPYFTDDTEKKSLDSYAIGSENESIFAPIWKKVTGY